MGITELFLVGVGLSMDAFAVAICRGLSMKKLEWKQALLVAVFFGGFQALMPTIGWVLGKQFEQYIVSVDHWIAFILLAYIGGKMIWDAFHEEEARPADFRVGELLIMAVATSIDALAVGITFAFLQVDIGPAAALIGCTTFIISLAGVWIGNRFGSRRHRQCIPLADTASKRHTDSRFGQQRLPFGRQSYRIAVEFGHCRHHRAGRHYPERRRRRRFVLFNLTERQAPDRSLIHFTFGGTCHGEIPHLRICHL